MADDRIEDCIFCKILSGAIPSKRVFEGTHCIAIEDKFPQAPVHCLVMPRKHIASLSDATESEGELLQEMLLVCQRVAAAKSIDKSGYRVITNVGSDGGQAVFHLHFHVLGGKRLGAKLVQGN